MKKVLNISLKADDEFRAQVEFLRKVALPYTLSVSEVIRVAVAAEVARKQEAMANV
jgi:hypothetical protein